MSDNILNKTENLTPAEEEPLAKIEATQNENLKVSLEEYKTIEEVFKTQREKNKLDLESLAIYAKLEGREKLSTWEKMRTIIPWVGVMGTLIFSLITYNYQKEKDRASLEKERAAIEQKRVEEKAEAESRQMKEKEQKEKEKRDELARNEALASAQEKDREEARRYRDAEHREHEKDREEARSKRDAELRQLQAARDARELQGIELENKKTQQQRENERLEEEKAFIRKNEAIQDALKVIKAQPIIGINKLATFGEETLPFIINEVSLEKDVTDWSTRAFAALGAIKRIGMDKLTDAEKLILKKRLYDCIEEVNSLSELFKRLDLPRVEMDFNELLKSLNLEPKEYNQKIKDARFTWQILFEIERLIRDERSPDKDLYSLIHGSCYRYNTFANPTYKRLISPICQ